ncbi:hypothetical protein NEOLEDRAFT_1152219 [Neolentinus lepideus HHB14362 ss-1]|uniref:Uncharacterized protein n=1 Tax=Neolentinus lepideus HHB14362 ss-1 TaxID=1314782 RepID=A0A165N0P9_9AGAM|nr:hypothetical protein NEOLEDRAFT_1152219 [Neolentinus lepideus HHB14362 ss-1]
MQYVLSTLSETGPSFVRSVRSTTPNLFRASRIRKYSKHSGTASASVLSSCRSFGAGDRAKRFNPISKDDQLNPGPGVSTSNPWDRDSSPRRTSAPSLEVDTESSLWDHLADNPSWDRFQREDPPHGRALIPDRSDRKRRLVQGVDNILDMVHGSLERKGQTKIEEIELYEGDYELWGSPAVCKWRTAIINLYHLDLTSKKYVKHSYMLPRYNVH